MKLATKASAILTRFRRELSNEPGVLLGKKRNSSRTVVFVWALRKSRCNVPWREGRKVAAIERAYYRFIIGGKLEQTLWPGSVAKVSLHAARIGTRKRRASSLARLQKFQHLFNYYFDEGWRLLFPGQTHRHSLFTDRYVPTWSKFFAPYFQGILHSFALTNKFYFCIFHTVNIVHYYNG